MLATLGLAKVHWVGTSMGGLIGMALAAQHTSAITRMVLNDVGPVITGASLKRIGEYVGMAPRFPEYAAAEKYIRAVSASFGPLTDAEWKHLTEVSIRRQSDGSYLMAYDPKIGVPFRVASNIGANNDIALWWMWDAIQCPTLLLRGTESDLLLRETAVEMTQRGPKAKLHEFSGIGHAPALLADDHYNSTFWQIPELQFCN